MRRETAFDFWKRYLHLVHNGRGTMNVENPLCEFALQVHAGEYNALSDEEYAEILKDYKQFNAIWKEMNQRPAGDVLLEALRMTQIDDDSIDHIAGVLARHSEHSDYLQQAKAVGQKASPASEAWDTGQGESDGADDLLSPREIYESLCGRIRGQEDAKKAASLLLFNHLQGRRSSAVFCGPSGCGKSEIWRYLSKEYPGLIRIMDASRLSADGWRGSLHLRDIFSDIPAEALEAHGLIVVLDEADKICCESAVGASGTNYNLLIQNNLLKMLDGDVIEFGEEDKKPAFSVDCSRVSIVLLGAFETLLQKKSHGGGIGFGAAPRVECDYGNTELTYSDMIGAGMRREIAGRINRIVSLRPLSVSDYREILTGPVLNDLQSAGQYTITIENAAADFLSAQAAASGLGVRWMRSQIMNAIDDLIFNDPHAGHYITIQCSAQRVGNALFVGIVQY